MGFALLAYNIASDSAGATFADMVAATDADFTQRNSHYTFTEDYKLLAAMYTSGATPKRVRFQVPTWNAVGQFELFNLGTTLEFAANYQADYWGVASPTIPQMEEFQVQASNGGAGTLQENAAIVVGTRDWNQNVDGGRLPIMVVATGTTTWTANAWSGPVAITLASSLRGGVYKVVGAQLQADDAVWFRLVFPRYKLYNGRKLRPGWAVTNAVGNAANWGLANWPFTLGVWGYFHTFELPQVEAFGTAADSTAWVLYMYLIYMGEDPNLINVTGSVGY